LLILIKIETLCLGTTNTIAINPFTLDPRAEEGDIMLPDTTGEASGVIPPSDDKESEEEDDGEESRLLRKINNIRRRIVIIEVTL
jgi:hypothetical protein